MYRFSKYRAEYKANLKLAFPVVLSQLGQVVVQLADNIMVGQYGGDNSLPLAAASFGGSVFFLINIVCMGLTFGITPIVGELFVQGRMKEASKYLGNSLVLFPMIGLLAMGLQLLLIPLMSYMGQPEEVVALAIPYYKTLVWGMIPIMVFFVFKQFLEGLGNTQTTMYIVILCNTINIILNYALINGVWGAPELGVLGAGLATLVSRVLQAAIIFIFFLSMKRFKVYLDNFKFKNLERRDSVKLVKIGLPISSQVFFECSAFVISSILMGYFGANIIGANQIGVSLMNCAFMIVLAVGSATTIRISHCYGTRDFERMKLASSAAYHLALVWNSITAIAFITLQSILPQLFTSNAEMIEMASLLLVFIALFQIPDGLQCISIGILRGMQDVKIILPISVFAYWILNIPVGCLCAFLFGMGPQGLYIGFIVGLSTAAVLLYHRIKCQQHRLISGGCN
ncbi:MAG: MATE family efflux transporter [Rikenellaceae bacterium]